MLIEAGGLRGLRALSTVELQQLMSGISTGRAAQCKAVIELGTRVARGEDLARKQIKSPVDVVELLLLKSYLAVVLNSCARQVVGWSMQPTLKRKLVLAALERAVRQRQPAR